MTWSSAGIQTGTDTDLTGLTSVTGVTSTTDGNLTTYTVPSTVTNALRIQGTQSHNTELERIVFQRAINSDSGSEPYIWVDGGTYNFGIEKVPGVFTDGVGIQCNGAGSIWYNGGFNSGSTSVNGTFITVGNNTAPSGGQLGGTLNINGGRILGQFHTTMRPNGVISNTYNAKYVVDSSNQSAGQEWLSRFYGGTFNTTNFAYEGGSISLGNGFQGSTIGFDRTGAGVAYWPQYDTAGDYDPSDGDTYATIRNAAFSSNVVDVAVRCTVNNETRAIRIQNCGNGSRVNVNGGETSAGGATNNAGYVWITKQVNTNFTSLADGSNAIGRVFVFDTDRQSNIQSPAPTVATGAITYIGDFNGALTSWTASGTGVGPTSINFEDENEIALAFFSKLRNGTGYARGTIDTGDWAWDRRSDGGVIGVDDFTFQAWSYENQFFEASQDLAGTGILTVANAFNPDSQTTGTKTNAGTILGVSITTDNNTVVVATANSLDNIYDRAKLLKETTDANNVSQATTRDWVLNESNGANIVGLASTKTLVSSAAISGGTTNNVLKPDGTLTLNAGANLSGLTLDRSGATGATTVQGLDTVVYTPNASGDLTISGAVSNSTVTVNGDIAINGNVTGGSMTGDTTIFDGSTVSGNASITATSTTAGATVRFNNDFNVSNCTLSSADNIRFDDGGSGTIGDNVTCSTTAADGIIVMRSNGSGDNFEVTASRMNTYDVTASRGLVILNGDIRVDLVGAVGSPTMTVAQLFGGTDNVPGTAGQITLTSDAPITIQTNDTSRFTYGTANNVTIEAIPAGLATNTWSIPTPVAGRYAVTSTIGGVNAIIQAPTDFAAGATVSGTISSSTYSTADSITMWVKYDSQFSAGSLQYYLENAQTLNFSSTDGTVLGFSPGSAEVAAFAIDEQADVPSNVSFTASADGNNALVEITNSSNASLTLTFNTSLQLIADIANSSAYFDSWFNNRGTTTAPIVVYGQGYVSNIDASRITFESGNTDGGFRLQHTTGNWSNSSSTGTFASSRTGAPEVVSVIAGLALVNPTDIRNAMDSSVAAGRVERIANAAGWLADDASLLPSVNPYVDATDYEGNL